MRLAGLLLLLVSTNAGAELPKTGGNHPTVKFQTECEGYSLTAAKQQCFNTAIEQVVGQVVVSDLESSGDRITRDNIGQYSAGYVDNYTIQDQRQDEHGWYHLKMTVSVASSKIAQRKWLKGEHSDVVNGDRIHAQIQSQLEQRSRGDALIAQILASYPENAYVINSGNSEFNIGRLRQPYVDIPYSITMSRPWVEAFNEALDLVAVNSTKCNTLSMVVANGIKQSRTDVAVKRLVDNVCGSEPDIRVFYKSGFIPTANSYYFTDIETLHIINNELKTDLGQQHLGLKVDLLDAGGNMIDSRCARINNELFIHYSPPGGTYNLNSLQQDSRPSVMGQNNVYGTLRIHINNVKQLEDLSRIKLNIQKTCI